MCMSSGPWVGSKDAQPRLERPCEYHGKGTGCGRWLVLSFLPHMTQDVRERLTKGQKMSVWSKMIRRGLNNDMAILIQLKLQGDIKLLRE